MRLKRMGRMASQARIQREFEDGDEQGADSKPEPPKARPVLRRRLSVRNRLEVCTCYHAEGWPPSQACVINTLCRSPYRVRIASMLTFEFSFRLFLVLPPHRVCAVMYSTEYHSYLSSAPISHFTSIPVLVSISLPISGHVLSLPIFLVYVN